MNQLGDHEKLQLMSQNEGSENGVKRNKRNALNQVKPVTKHPRITSECGFFENVPMELDKHLPNKVFEKEVRLSNTIQDLTNQPILNLQDSIGRIESEREERNKYLYLQIDEVKHMNSQIKEMDNVLKKEFSEWTISEKNHYINPEQLRDRIDQQREEIRREKDRIDQQREEIRREKEKDRINQIEIRREDQLREEIIREKDRIDQIENRMEKEKDQLREEIIRIENRMEKEKDQLRGEIRRKEDRIDDEVKHMNSLIKEMDNVLKKDFSEWTMSEKNQYVNPEQLRDRIVQIEIRREKEKDQLREEIIREKDQLREEIIREKDRIDQIEIRREKEKDQLREEIRMEKDQLRGEIRRKEDRIDGFLVPGQKENIDEKYRNDLSKMFDTVPRLEELEDFLTTKLLCQIPISYDQNRSNLSSLDELIVTMNVQNSDLLNIVATLVDYFSVPNSSENMGIYPIDCLVRRVLNFFASVVPLRMARNVSDVSTSNKRPDFLCWVREFLIFRGEEKAHEKELETARCELISKLNVFSTQKLFGNIPYFFGYACAGKRFQFYAITEKSTKKISKEYNLTFSAHRFAIFRSMVNLVRLFVTINPILTESCPLPIGHKLINNDGSRTILFLPNCVIKTWTDAEDTILLRQIYSDTKDVVHLIHSKKFKDSFTNPRKVQLTLEPIGYERYPRNENELKLAIKHVLIALKGLHAAGYVHRDVRWPNILSTLKDDYWFLIDLEAASKIGTPITWAGHRHPPEAITNITWVERSDIYMVGKLITFLNIELSSIANELVVKLCHNDFNQRYSAEEALKQSWFD